MTVEKLDINYSKSFTRNVVTNVINLLVNTIVGLLMVPFFLNSLGPAAYALIPLATSINSYVIFVINIINASVSRYLSVELQSGDINRARETYSTSFVIFITGALILLPISIALAVASPHIFQTGDTPSEIVILFFIMIFVSVLISALKSNFMTILFAHNRLDLLNGVQISQTVIQNGLIVVLLLALGPSLLYVGGSYIAAAVVSFILAFLFAKRQRFALKFSFADFRKTRVKELGGLTFLYLFDQLGCVLQSQIALIVVNIYFGAVAQAEYSLVISWGLYMVTLCSILTSTVAPKIYSLAADDDRKEIFHFTGIFTKFIGLLVALPVALLCIFAPQLMTLWVGPEYAHLAPLVWLLLPVYYITVAHSPQVPIAIAYLKMKFPAILNIVVGLVYLALALLLPVVFNIGYYGVALAYVIVMFLHHGIFLPVYYCWVIKVPYLSFIKKMLPGFAAMLALMAFGVLITLVIDVNPFWVYVSLGAIISIGYLFIMAKFLLTGEEKMLAKTCLPEFMQNMRIVKWL
ncbi:MAG TPA: hypothetical protein O0X39_08325 [Methanocorpusculum sp.]|nr:hypothetical protein [Methanocorpusculum sp.]